MGLGGIGAVVAGCLEEAAEQEVVVCTRRPISELLLERPEGDVRVKLRALTEADDAPAADWVLICTKAYQTASTEPWLRQLCTSSTRVAVLQNGMGQISRVAPILNGARAVPSIVYYNAERIGPAHVRLRHVAEYDIAVRDDGDGREFAELFARTPIRVQSSGDFVTLAWRKLLLNAVANPITTLTLQRAGVFRRRDIRDLGLKVLEEAVAVARADGAQLASDEAAQSMETLLSYPADAGSSMYFDRIAGRELEVEALTGAVVAAGERLGVRTPLNSALEALLKALSAGQADSLGRPPVAANEVHGGKDD